MNDICGHESTKLAITDMINSKTYKHIFLYGSSGIGKKMIINATINMFKNKLQIETYYIDCSKPIHNQLIHIYTKYYNGLKIVILKGFANQSFVFKNSRYNIVILVC